MPSWKFPDNKPIKSWAIHRVRIAQLLSNCKLPYRVRVRCLARVRAAFLAAAERSRGPLVRAACLADAARSEAGRFFAALRACRESAVCEAADVLSFFKDFTAARDRVVETGSCRFPFLYALSADFLVFSETLPFGGGLRSTPARRALFNPMAIACFADFAPCFPSRICSISS